MLPMGLFLQELCLPRMIDRYCQLLQLLRATSTLWSFMSLMVSPHGADTSHQQATGESPESKRMRATIFG